MPGPSVVQPLMAAQQQPPMPMQQPPQGQPVPGQQPMDAAGVDEEAEAQAFIDGLKQMVQQIPPEQLMQMAGQNQEQLLEQFVQAILPQVGEDKAIALEMAGMLLQEVNTAAQLLNNKTLGEINPELMQPPDQRGQQPMQPQQSQMPSVINRGV